MRDLLRTRAWAASAASAVFILAAGGAPTTTLAADHLDSPTVSQHGADDITDVYAFSSKDGARSVFVVNVNPGAGVLPASGTTFGHNTHYYLKVDTNGDLTPDVTFTWKFSNPKNGAQDYTLWRNGSLLVHGRTGTSSSLQGGGRATAGLFDDPFFFDLDAFKGQVLGNGDGRKFCDSHRTDFFKGLNVSSMVIRVPNAWVGGNDKDIAVWATTEVKRGGQWVQIDQMGRPAINTVFNNVDTVNHTDKELFNRSQPSEQVGLGYRSHVAAVLKALGGDPSLAKVLIADVLTFHTSNTAGFLNGRQLNDDVIDAELNLVTGGGLKSDCIRNDSAFPGTWPYLAPAN